MLFARECVSADEAEPVAVGQAPAEAATDDERATPPQGASVAEAAIYALVEARGFHGMGVHLVGAFRDAGFDEGGWAVC